MPKTSSPKLSLSEIAALGKRLDADLMQRRLEYSRYATAFYGSSASVPAHASVGKRVEALRSLSDQNLLRAVLEAAHASVANDPEITVMTTGSWSKQMSARKLTRVISGVRHSVGQRAISSEVLTDAMLAPLGASRRWMDNGKLRAERVPPHTLIWSQAAGRNPRQLWLRYGAPRREVENRFGKSLPNAPRYRPDPGLPTFTAVDSQAADRIEVWEYHERAQGDAAGRILIYTGDETILDDQEWPFEFFSIVSLKWSESFDDFGGTPLAAQVWPFHLALQRMNAVMEKGVALACVPRLFVQKGTEVKQLTNTPLERVEYTGTKPEITTPQAFPKEFYDVRNRIKSEAFEFPGISLNFASAQQNAGIESGRAKREAAEQADRRLGDVFQRIQEFNEQCAKVDLALMQLAYGGPEGKSVIIKAPGTKQLLEVDFKSIDLKEDETVLRCSSVNAIARTPTAKFEQVLDLQKLLGAKFRPEWALAALNMPGSVDQFEDDMAAYTTLALWQIDKALEENKYEAPEAGPAEYLETVIELGNRELMDARPFGAPEENLDTLRKLIAAAEDNLKKLQAAAPPPPASVTEPTNDQ